MKTPTAGTSNLMELSRATRHPVLSKFFRDLAEPHDRIFRKNSTTSEGGITANEYRVKPLEEDILDKDGKVRFAGTLRLRLFLANEWTEDKVWEVKSSYIDNVTYYEQLTLNRVNDLLDLNNKTNNLTDDDKWRAAQVVLTSVLNFHDSAYEAGRRRGERFPPLRESLRHKLLEVQLKQLKALVERAEWDKALDLGKSLADSYPEPNDQARIAAPLAAAVQKAIDEQIKGSGKVSEEQMKRLRLIEQMFPASQATGPARELMRKEAENLFKKAQDLAAKDKKTALLLMQHAEDLFPRLPELHFYRLKLENEMAVLRVGVRQLPRHLMPGLAFTDAEKQAGELLFESLVKLGSDGDGNPRWQPVLAQGAPKLVPLGRQFQLARDAYWSNDKPVTPADVLHTVRQLRNPRWPGYSPAWANLVEEPLVTDGARVTLLLSQGYLQPESLMTFKVLPVAPWGDQPLTPGDEVKFDQAPVGSGPYTFQGRGKNVAGREYVSFVANPAYGSRAGKRGLPRIREVQFYQTTEPFRDLQDKKLDMIIDAPNSAVASIANLPWVQVQTTPTRRIYFLAVNHRRTTLQNQELRKALAHAIDRDAVLDGVFRPNLGPNVHRALNGPFPPGSWGCSPDVGAKLHNPGLARTRMKTAEEKGFKGVELTLKYLDDPETKLAMEMLARQVQETVKVTLKPVPRSADELRKDVEVTHDYELAYYWYDYPSQAYWLWPLFDPQAIHEKGTNFLGYQNDSELASQFGMIMGRRDFAEVKKLTHILHGMLVDKMPLIPLWQLDTHLALHNELQATISDPLLVFTDVEQWRFEKK
jgi:peptide/nickel transport system substrate-binding protein